MPANNTPQLPEIAVYRLTFDGERWTREGFLEDGTLVDCVWWRHRETPVLPSTPAPFRADLTLSGARSRGRNGWFRTALARVRTWSIAVTADDSEVTIDAHGRRDASTPPISLGLSRRDAEALGWALIAVATAPVDSR